MIKKPKRAKNRKNKRKEYMYAVRQGGPPQAEGQLDTQ
jgi:hypothetical protein